MVKNHAHCTSQPNYLIEYRALKILNDSTLLLKTHNGKERKTNINDVKPFSTAKLIENAWNAFWKPSKVTVKLYTI